MMYEDRTDAFLDLISGGKSEFLTELEETARADRVPIIRTAVQHLLKFIITERKPEDILEIGSAIGFSSILMREAGGDGLRITTIELDEDRANAALQNIEKAGYSDDITLIKGDAAEVIKTLDKEYDIIFLDAAKGQYPFLLSDIKRLLKKGGLLITDNCLQEGDVLESRYAVRRRDRTIHARMREFIREIYHDEDLNTCLMPMADGVALSIKK
ncbi:MAG: O-methyltransferase [Lachnospiraceae bacterium]|nr:O-methyltransferase [Lachnospiraceae bacterium]